MSIGWKSVNERTPSKQLLVYVLKDTTQQICNLELDSKLVEQIRSSESPKQKVAKVISNAVYGTVLEVFKYLHSWRTTGMLHLFV